MSGPRAVLGMSRSATSTDTQAVVSNVSEVRRGSTGTLQVLAHQEPKGEHGQTVDVLGEGAVVAGEHQAERCICFDADSRTCYELRYYGRSPIPRTDWDHSEAAYFEKDDGDCECPCHDGKDDDDDYLAPDRAGEEREEVVLRHVPDWLAVLDQTDTDHREVEVSNALATVQYKPTDLDTNQLGQVLVKSGFFQDTKDVAQAIVKVLAGRELGFGPIASMQGVYIVKGRVTLSANLVGAAIQRSGKYGYEVVELTNDKCTLQFFSLSKPHGTPGFVSTFTIQDAQQAGINSDTYKKFPRNMLFARALTNGARWFCPEVFNGPIYTPDELGAAVDDEGSVTESNGNVVAVSTGEVIEERQHEKPADGPKRPLTRDDVLTRYVELYDMGVSKGFDFGDEWDIPDGATLEEIADKGKALKKLVEAVKS